MYSLCGTVDKQKVKWAYLCQDSGRFKWQEWKRIRAAGAVAPSVGKLRQDVNEVLIAGRHVTLNDVYYIRIVQMAWRARMAAVRAREHNNRRRNKKSRFLDVDNCAVDSGPPSRIDPNGMPVDRSGVFDTFSWMLSFIPLFRSVSNDAEDFTI